MIRKVVIILLASAAIMAVILVSISEQKAVSISAQKQMFSDEITTQTFDGDMFYVVPDSKLDDALVIVDKRGKKYYVISEKKLRLLGPKLLTGGDGND